jgi:hypothetical protein
LGQRRGRDGGEGSDEGGGELHIECLWLCGLRVLGLSINVVSRCD